MRRKLTENVQWYKESNKGRENDEIETTSDDFINRDKSKWKPWKKKKWRIRGKEKKIEREGQEKSEEEERIRGVFFIPHTEHSELAKRIREKLKSFEEISNIKIKLVERTGEKLVDILHKSNPWEDTYCEREDCAFCNGGNTKLIGKCKKRNIVYETECLLCRG